MGELLAERYGMPMWRPTNSGTEATMDAIRLARGATKRDKIVKVEGGFHGHHDEVMISNKPPLDKAGPADAPNSVPQSAGITRGTIADVIVIPFNDPDALERALANDDVACFIVEPVMENIGICLPLPGYLEAVREITARHGTLLIFDEVKTGITAGYGGATEKLGVQPDLIALAKSIGGGFPVGAFGGKRRVHEPHHHRRGAAPRHLQRQPARDGRGEGHAHRGMHAAGGRSDDRPQRQAGRRLRRGHPALGDPGPHRRVRRQGLHHVVARTGAGTTATTRRPTSTSRSRNGSTGSTGACCCRRASTSSG